MIIIGMIIGMFGAPVGVFKVIFECVLVVFITFCVSVFGFHFVEMSSFIKKIKTSVLSYVR
jgi:hypothetical protein